MKLKFTASALASAASATPKTSQAPKKLRQGKSSQAVTPCTKAQPQSHYQAHVTVVVREVQAAQASEPPNRWLPRWMYVRDRDQSIREGPLSESEPLRFSKVCAFVKEFHPEEGSSFVVYINEGRFRIGTILKAVTVPLGLDTPYRWYLEAEIRCAAKNIKAAERNLLANGWWIAKKEVLPPSHIVPLLRKMLEAPTQLSTTATDTGQAERNGSDLAAKKA